MSVSPLQCSPYIHTAKPSSTGHIILSHIVRGSAAASS